MWRVAGGPGDHRDRVIAHAVQRPCVRHVDVVTMLVQRQPDEALAALPPDGYRGAPAPMTLVGICFTDHRRGLCREPSKKKVRIICR